MIKFLHISSTKIKKEPKYWIVNNVNNFCHMLIMIYGQQGTVLKLAAKAEVL